MNNRELFENFIIQRNNLDSAFRFAYGYVKNREEAEDVVSESVVKALRKCGALNSPEYMKTWFYRIIINTALTHLKKKNRETAADVEFLAASDYACDDLSNLAFDGLLNLLPVKYREVVLLRFFEDMKLEEISSLLGIPLSTVKTRLYAALKALRVQIGDEKF